MKQRSLQEKSLTSLQFFKSLVRENSLIKTGQLLLIAIVLMSAGFVLGRSGRATEANSDIVPAVTEQVNILPVTTVKIEPVTSYQTTQTYTGEVTALRTSEVGFELAGKLVSLVVDEGDRVKRGQTIAQLDTATLQAQRQGLVAQKAQAQAVLAELQNGARSEQIASAKARVRDLQRQLELEKIKNSRREYLYREGAIAKEQLDEIAFNRQALQERLNDAQSNLAELENGTRIEQITAQQAAIEIIAANIAELDTRIDKSILNSPFDGVVSRRNFDEGTVIEAGQSVVRLVESDRLEVRIGVPVSAVSGIITGSEQEIQINGNNYSATVDSILPEIDASTRTRTIILTLDTAANRQIAPGEIARFPLTQTTNADGYWLPIKAIKKSDRGLWSCYSVVTNDAGETIVKRQYVEIIATQSDRVLVKGTIGSEDLIVTDGIHRLVPGQRVSRK